MRFRTEVLCELGKMAAVVNLVMASGYTVQEARSRTRGIRRVLLLRFIGDATLNRRLMKRFIGVNEIKDGVEFFKVSKMKSYAKMAMFLKPD